MSYAEIVEEQKTYFNSKVTLDLNYRIKALSQLKETIKTFERDIFQALKDDLNKSEFESYSSEVGVILQEISFTLKQLRRWAKPTKAKTPITHLGSRSYIYPEPYGVSLIIAPWNYPFQLCLAPLIGAIAAGNCAVIKPSELTPHTANIVGQIIQRTFPEDYITVINGGVEVSQDLLSLPFDKIFFTGSTRVGKIVMKQASEHLVPTTLELGGKSPCIVHEDANLKLAAKRIAWGKFLNAGQTCIAPDYLYVHQSVKEEFLSYLKEAIEELYGKEPLKNEDYTRIVNEEHFERLSSFIDDHTVCMGGKRSKDQLMIEPTVLTPVTWEDSIMKDEIFGPILPVLEFRELSEVIHNLNNQAHPLALYLFSNEHDVQEWLVNETSFGGGCINDTVYHFASSHLPFGGVGASGMGAYHGKASFETFSHQKSVLKQTVLFDLPFRYPNIKNGLNKLKWFLK